MYDEDEASDTSDDDSDHEWFSAADCYTEESGFCAASQSFRGKIQEYHHKDGCVSVLLAPTNKKHVAEEILGQQHSAGAFDDAASKLPDVTLFDFSSA